MNKHTEPLVCIKIKHPQLQYKILEEVLFINQVKSKFLFEYLSYSKIEFKDTNIHSSSTKKILEKQLTRIRS
jgi:hypothetical protein